MMTVWKYSLAIEGDAQVIRMPRGARLLSVQVQATFGMPMLWALVNDSAPKTERTFWVVGTGHPSDHVKGATYIGTFQMESGALVWHVFVDPEQLP